ncbi:MAG: hypothetical protein WBC44_10480 [Planctomycetaceae bacterium]
MNASPAPPEDDDWAMSFAFWGVLLVAGALFATVALAPKLHTLVEQKADYATNQRRLVELEHRADELERVAEAIEHDPEFAAELAKVEFTAGRPGDERIAVHKELQLGGDDAVEPAAEAVGGPMPAGWSMPPLLLDPLATHAGLRATLLSIAAILTLVAFVVLNEAHAATVRAVVDRGAQIGRSMTKRYTKA